MAARGRPLALTPLALKPLALKPLALTLCAGALLASLAGCTHSHLAVAMTFYGEEAGVRRLSGVSPVDTRLGGTAALLLDFDEVPAMDLTVFRGKGVTEVSLWPGEGHAWRLEWKGDGRYAVTLSGGDATVRVSGADAQTSLRLGAEAALLLERDGHVFRREGDAERGSWQELCHGTPGQRGDAGQGHGHPHSHGGGHSHSH